MSRRQYVSQHLPPHLRDALVRAAELGAHEEIDRLTDLAAISYPDLVLPRTTCRHKFAPTSNVTRGRDAS